MCRKFVPALDPIFAIFEGGGAKGIAHVGAYAAADELQFEFVGVAGALAGAIVASLIAVGFKPNKIFNPDIQGENIFSAHSLSPTEALGARDWRQFQRLRWLWFRMWIPFLVLFLRAFALKFLGWPLTARILGGLAIFTAVSTAVRAWLLLNKSGIFDPVHFAGNLNEVLRQRVLAVYQQFEKPADRLPTKSAFAILIPEWFQGFAA
jgi:hypothetical protein